MKASARVPQVGDVVSGRDFPVGRWRIVSVLAGRMDVVVVRDGARAGGDLLIPGESWLGEAFAWDDGAQAWRPTA